jgi:hypothetical protein
VRVVGPRLEKMGEYVRKGGQIMDFRGYRKSWQTNHATDSGVALGIWKCPPKCATAGADCVPSFGLGTKGYEIERAGRLASSHGLIAAGQASGRHGESASRAADACRARNPNAIFVWIRQR